MKDCGLAVAASRCMPPPSRECMKDTILFRRMRKFFYMLSGDRHSTLAQVTRSVVATGRPLNHPLFLKNCFTYENKKVLGWYTVGNVGGRVS